MPICWMDLIQPPSGSWEETTAFPIQVSWEQPTTKHWNLKSTTLEPFGYNLAAIAPAYWPGFQEIEYLPWLTGRVFLEAEPGSLDLITRMWCKRTFPAWRVASETRSSDLTAALLGGSEMSSLQMPVAVRSVEARLTTTKAKPVLLQEEGLRPSRQTRKMRP